MSRPTPADQSVENASEPPAKTSVNNAPSLPKIVPFTELSRCGEEVWISHNGQLYRLRSTKQGKLILTK
ncbi:hemin uptake protein HemP [Aureliella helgolandensis]|uniref:Hemin uptake protein hemP n=1 Tax=Aureliella helgolandensis TaxID=2527968 RepID=A0A518G176_9BACT|nr:hemin uptake protein HemP [Aureliella helgolandensis]QDV22290.1 hypothetical protein Q31a_05740 [Aureliella helgolandensis]